MKKSLLILSAIAIALVSTLTGCDALKQASSRKFGGTITITLPPGERLVNISWKDADNSLWILTKNNATIPAQQYTFQEDSAYGVLQGKVIIKEQ